MKHRILALALGLALLLSACSSRDAQPMPSDTAASQSAPAQEAAFPAPGLSNVREAVPQLLMIYMVGSDLETEAGVASADLSEITGSGFDDEKLAVLICTGGAKHWWTERIPSDACCIFRASAGKLNPVHTMSGKNMAEPASLTEFIDYGYSHFDAEVYNLILWNHGGGAVLGFGMDENHNNDALTLAEMDSALQNTDLVKDGKCFEWVGFDACLMGMLELADLFSEYSEYLIASEEQEPAKGWDYSFLKTLSREDIRSGDEAARVILDKYRNYYEFIYKYSPDYTLSCLDLSHTDAVISALEKLVSAAANELQNNGYSRIAKLRAEVKSFGKTTNTGIYDTVDLFDLAERMSALYPEEAAALQAALEQLVVHNARNVYGAHGVAIYFPYENKKLAEEWLDIYKTAGFCDEYLSFLQAFTGTLYGEQLAQWNISELTPEEDPLQTGSYYVQLTESQLENFAAARYSIWEEDNPGSYICWINSRDVSVTESGQVHSGFAGDFFYIGDSSGNLLPGCAFEVERNEAYVKYAIPVMILPGDNDTNFVMHGAYIHLRVDAEHQKAQIIGVYNTLDADSNLFPRRDLAEITEGDYIYPFYFARQIVTREDGSLAPFSEWVASSGVGSYFELCGELQVTISKQAPGKEYCCLFLISDTQGNSFFTNSTFVTR